MSEEARESARETTDAATATETETEEKLDAAGADAVEERIVEALKTVYDPEIPVNIYELGLIYDVNLEEVSGFVHCKMTLTSPGCPVAGTLPGEVEAKIASVAGVSGAEVELVWDPVWNPSMMTEEAKLQLGML